MTEIFQIVIENLEKVGIGALLFLGAYMSNVCLGAWPWHWPVVYCCQHFACVYDVCGNCD